MSKKKKKKKMRKRSEQGQCLAEKKTLPMCRKKDDGAERSAARLPGARGFSVGSRGSSRDTSLYSEVMCVSVKGSHLDSQAPPSGR